MESEGMIELKDVDLRKFVQKVYEMSKPQGLGYMHFKEGGLSDEEADSLIRAEGRIAVSLDYVRGRACKMVVWRDKETGKLFVRDTWYDHTLHQLKSLLSEFGIELPAQEGQAKGWGTAA